MSSCFTDADLVRFMNVGVVDLSTSGLADHLDACPSCQRRANLLSEAPELREYSQCYIRRRPPQSSEPLPPDLLNRLYRLPYEGRPVREANESVKDPASGGRVADAECRNHGHSVPQTIGRYRILREIGRGGMGVVYEALHSKLKKRVALKLLCPRKRVDRHLVERFNREMEAVGQLDHPNIIAASDAGDVDGSPFLVMKLIEGADLAEVTRWLGGLSPVAACEIVRQTALGLEHAHAHGITHRDIKPSNLLLDQNGCVKIVDLGLAQLRSSEYVGDEVTASGVVMGTVGYMAPEQAINTKYADRRSDVYSLGCTLHFLLAGRPVFDWATMAETLIAHRELPVPVLTAVCPDAPPELDVIFQRMLAKRPVDRYQSMTDLIADLAAVFPEADRAAAVAAIPVTEIALSRPEDPSQTLHQSAAVLTDRGAYDDTGVFAKQFLGAEFDPLHALEASARSDRSDGRQSLPPNEASYSSAAAQTETVRRRRLAGWVAGIGGVMLAGLLAARGFTTAGSTATELTEAAVQPVAAVQQSGNTPIADTPAVSDDGSGQSLKLFLKQPGVVTTMGFLGDGRRIFCGVGTRAQIWDLENRSLIREFGPHPIEVSTVTATPDASRLVSGSKDGFLRVFDVETGAEIQSMRTPSFCGITTIAVLPDGRRALSGDWSGRLGLWDLETGKELHASSVDAAVVYCVAVSRDGRLAFFGGQDHSATLWDVENWQDVRRMPHGDRVLSTAFSPDGRLAASGSWDGTARVWEVDGGDEFLSIPGVFINSITFTPDGRWFLAGDRAGDLSIWNVADRREVRTYRGDHRIEFLAVSPDGRQALTSTGKLHVVPTPEEGRLHLWQLPAP
jgi:eukaryotic-like serine/threonine-protein kinase